LEKKNSFLVVSFFSLLAIENLQQKPLNFRDFKILKFSFFWRNFAPRKKERKKEKQKKTKKGKNKGVGGGGTSRRYSAAAAFFFFFRLRKFHIVVNLFLKIK
jgi:hypothetical protein